MEEAPDSGLGQAEPLQILRSDLYGLLGAGEEGLADGEDLRVGVGGRGEGGGSASSGDSGAAEVEAAMVVEKRE